MFATETSYGLGADATNTRAVARLMAIKGREGWKTPPLVAADVSMVRTYVFLSKQLQMLANKFWPGPLTIVALVRPESRLCPDVIREGTVAIRVSSHTTARALSAGLGAPIVATSANRTGQESCYDIAYVHAQFDACLLQPDFYFDEGPLPHRSASTIVTEQDGVLVVLRKGEIDITTRYVA